MNKKIMVLTAVGVGFIGGFLTKKGLDIQALSSERVLSKVKAAVKETIDIDGAWIFLEKENWVNNDVSYDVFKGGLTEVVDEETVHYDFIADARTGTLLHIEEN